MTPCIASRVFSNRHGVGSVEDDNQCIRFGLGVSELSCGGIRARRALAAEAVRRNGTDRSFAQTAENVNQSKRKM